MAGGLTPTKLPVATFAKLMGINPLHFMGVQIPQIQRRGCDQAWFQYEWQTADLMSRDEVSLAIAQAEGMIEAWLGFRLLPSWEADEAVATTRNYQAAMLSGFAPVLANPVGNLFGSYTGDIRGYRKTIVAQQARFISGGIRAATVIELAAAVAYTNTGVLPTTWKNRATVTTTVVAGTNPEQIRIFYPGHNGDETWRIVPVNVSISGTVCTITFDRELAVIESLLTSLDRSLDAAERIAQGDDDADFLETVDVYRVYNDPSVMATLLWEPGPSVCVDGSPAYPDADDFVSTTGMLQSASDPKWPILSYARGTWDATNSRWVGSGGGYSYDPDQLRINYFAGFENKSMPSPRNDLDPFLARIVAQLAASLLGQPGCKCSTVTFGRWQQDLAISEGNDGGAYSKFQNTSRILDCPWGTRRGAWMAWAQLQLPSGGLYDPIHVQPF